MDACRTAVRLGAEEVSIIYRRTRDEMPAEDIEITEAMEEGGYSEADGYTERGRRRDRMGRYARSDGHDGYNRGSSYHDPMMYYHDARHTYASTRTPESKRDMTENLTECLHTMKGDLQDMLNGATTREERDKIKAMLREIGNLA